VSPSIDGAEGDADVVGQDRVWGGSLGGQEKAGSLEVVGEVLGCDEVVLGDVLLVAAAQEGAAPGGQADRVGPVSRRRAREVGVSAWSGWTLPRRCGRYCHGRRPPT